MNDEERVERLLAGLVPPGPPAELEARVLQAAREAVARAQSRDDWTRVWESRPWRLAWAAATGVLLVAHAALFLSAPRVRPVAVAAPPAWAEEPEIATLARLPRLDVDARTLGGPAPQTAPDRSEPRRTAAPQRRGEEGRS